MVELVRFHRSSFSLEFVDNKLICLILIVVVEDNGVTKVHGIRKEVRDREDASDLRSGSAVDIPAEVDRRLLQIGHLTGQVAEIMQNSANVGGLLHRCGTICKEERMDRRAGRTERDPRKVRVEQTILQTDKKFVDGDDKEVGREGAALVNTSLRGERISGLAIN